MQQRQRGRPGSWSPRSGSALEGRRLWEIGSWGNASDHIGQRWEQLGRRALDARLDATEAGAAMASAPKLICLVDDRSVQSALQSLGLTNPDALLAELTAGRIHLRPVDFKWSIETASYRQISAEALRALLDHEESPLPAFVCQTLGVEEALDVETHDGFFYAPDNRPNRSFLDSGDNRRQEYPIDADEVVFETVDGREFFGALPWWPQATLLASLDRDPAALHTIDGAERYYRLGAGLGGALVKLNTSIFAAEPADLDVPGTIDALLAKYAFRASTDVIEHLRRLMLERDDRVRRLKELSRCPYNFGDVVSDLAAAGIYFPEGSGPAAKAVRERWGPVHRSIVAAHRAAVQRAGLALVAAGHTESAALTVLSGRHAEFADLARTSGRATLRRELGSSR